jgi:hypothetical protein
MKDFRIRKCGTVIITALIIAAALFTTSCSKKSQLSQGN